MKKIAYLVLFVVSFSPSLAAADINTTQINDYAKSIIMVINNILVPVLIAIAFITFLWGVYKYFILHAEEEKSREEGRSFILWGVIGFVVILSVWALVGIVGGTLNLPTGGSPTPPTFGTGK